MPRPKLVYVEWYDHASVNPCAWGKIQETIDEGKAFVKDPCVSVGFLVHQDDNCLVLVSHLQSLKNYDPEGDGSGDQVILRCAVKRIEHLPTPKSK